ncbi:MAG: RNA-binding protein [Planctomycetota bacterium]|jgi:hypothetical protein
MKPFGLRAIEAGYATEEQILEALRLQYNAKILLGKHLLIGEVLLLQGVIEINDLGQLLDETGENHEEAEDLHGGRFFGDVAVKLGFCKPEDLFAALNLQRSEDEQGERHRLIGEILYDEGNLTDEQVREVVAQLVDRVPEGSAFG